MREREKISLTLPKELRQRLEERRIEHGQRVGFTPSLSQVAEALIQRALSATQESGPLRG